MTTSADLGFGFQKRGSDKVNELIDDPDCCAGETPLCAIRFEAKSCSLLGQPTAWQGKIE
jgi:hypothetical protein